MFSTHASKKLSAYCNDELSADESRPIAEHLLVCPQCRAEFEEIKLGASIAGLLPTLSAPVSMWSELESRIDATSATATMAARPVSFWWNARVAALAASLLVAVGVAVIWIYSRESRPFWVVAKLAGAPTVGSTTIHDEGRLGLGEWLETDAASRAKIEVGSIGLVEIDPNTRVRLLATKPTEHRLELARGRMSAYIWAPPRLFFVDTPSAIAADLGCAYTLEVDSAGAGLLRVTSGWVALQLHGRESMVPAGAACVTRPVVGPGTPYFEDASASFREALTKVDFDSLQGKELDAMLEIVLLQARLRDTLTLWHLLPRVGGSSRERVYDRLSVFAPPPQGVTREGILQLNEEMLQRWKEALERSWGGPGTLKKGWLKMWTGAVEKIDGIEKKR